MVLCDHGGLQKGNTLGISLCELAVCRLSLKMRPSKEWRGSEGMTG